MGGGRGMGMAPAGGPGYQPQRGELSKEEELAALKEQARMLQEQLEDVKEQIDRVDKKK
jgi:hypothetical protein